MRGGPSYRLILALVGRLAIATGLNAQTCDIYGVVTDSLTRQRIPSANITLLGSTRGAASNNVGFYIIPKLPSGNYEVSASVMGYTKVTKRVVLREGRSIELNFELQAAEIQEREVVVSGSRRPVHTESAVSVHVLDQQDIRSISVAAQQDLLQALKILPGIVSTSDVSSRF
jgi:outer membrane receptor for ferrienterochelin and colicins